MIFHSLLLLPIHLRSYDEYYADHERFVQRQKVRVEQEQGKPFDSLQETFRKYMEHTWRWPPWMFNDVIGFLDVGLDVGGRMKGDISLKRMHWRREALEQIGQGRGDGREAHDMLPYCDTATREIDSRHNDSCRSACQKTVEQAQEIVRNGGWRTPRAHVWLPAYPLTCIDFASAIETMRAHARQEGEP